MKGRDKRRKAKKEAVKKAAKQVTKWLKDQKNAEQS